MMTLGAVGGFLSGLLQAQSTQITFTEYLENMLKLQLRPLVGALVSLILYTLLSWQILPGSTIVNVGSYFLIAFLSRFSERYFLQLLKTEAEKPNEKTGQARRRQRCGVGDRRYLDAEERQALGRCRCAICFGIGQDGQLPDASVTDAGARRGAGDGSAAPFPESWTSGAIRDDVIVVFATAAGFLSDRSVMAEPTLSGHKQPRFMSPGAWCASAVFSAARSLHSADECMAVVNSAPSEHS
jgi:hypothetical protein